nr:hypothetical protein [Tanacetum cinerariifolium]
HKVPDTKDTIICMLETQDIVYTVDMFHDTFKLPVETPDHLFVVLATIEIIESFMHKVCYQGVVDKVSAFFTKNLAQPWQTMFKVFNPYLTTRTSGHDQTKINILQLFHAVINRTNVDYVGLLWWEFMNNVFQKKDVIQYPRFTKLIIANLMKKYLSISSRLEEDYHSINDDILLEICATDDYKETTPRAHKTPTLTVASPQGKKRKQSARDTSLPRKSHKITIRKKKQNTTPIPPPGGNREGDEMAKATLLIFTLYKTALAAEAQENIAKVQEKLDEDEIEKMVEGEEDEESYASDFADSMLNDDVDDSGTRIEPGSHKENPKVVDDDDDDKNDKKGENDKKRDDVQKANDAMQTPIPTPTRSPRNDLSSNKKISEELMANVSPTTDTTSKTKVKRGFTSNKTKILPGSISGMCRRRGQICHHIKTKFVTHEFFIGNIQEVLDHCNNFFPKMTFAKTNETIKEEDATPG